MVAIQTVYTWIKEDFQPLTTDKIKWAIKILKTGEVCGLDNFSELWKNLAKSTKQWLGIFISTDTMGIKYLTSGAEQK